jgi:hypothetical protein
MEYVCLQIFDITLAEAHTFHLQMERDIPDYNVLRDFLSFHTNIDHTAKIFTKGKNEPTDADASQKHL